MKKIGNVEIEIEIANERPSNIITCDELDEVIERRNQIEFMKTYKMVSTIGKTLLTMVIITGVIYLITSLGTHIFNSLTTTFPRDILTPDLY